MTSLAYVCFASTMTAETPQEPDVQPMTVRFPKGLHRDLGFLAMVGNTNMNALVIKFAQEGIASMAAEQPAIAAALDAFRASQPEATAAFKAYKQPPTNQPGQQA